MRKAKKSAEQVRSEELADRLSMLIEHYRDGVGDHGAGGLQPFINRLQRGRRVDEAGLREAVTAVQERAQDYLSSLEEAASEADEILNSLPLSLAA